MRTEKHVLLGWLHSTQSEMRRLDCKLDTTRLYD